MTTMNISLPKAMREFVEDEVTKRGYATASEYIRELLREAQKRKPLTEIEALLNDGLNSGKPIEITAQYWKSKQRGFAARTGKKRKK